MLNGFALVSLLSWAFTYYFVPETKGKALEDIGATKRERAWLRNRYCYLCVP